MVDGHVTMRTLHAHALGWRPSPPINVRSLRLPVKCDFAKSHQERLLLARLG
jgi:hypothetical protein